MTRSRFERFAGDTRVRALFFQLVTVGLILAVAGWLVGNTLTNLSDRGITGGFDFLSRSARFPISESVLPYEPSDSFAWAFVVGLTNTLMLTLVIAAVSTALGFVVALARRSKNPLAVGVSSTFVEALRNTPLVVQLLFWYALVTVGLPNVRAALNPVPGVYLVDRGLYVPSIHLSGSTTLFTVVALLSLMGLAASIVVGRATRLRTGRKNRYGLIAAVAGLVAVGAAWVGGGVQIGLDRPQLGRFNFVGGATLTPELVALLLGLVLYSAAFIGEILRGGIDAIGRGQWEAGRAAGLTEGQILSRVIVPQALRVIIPPMTSQYINILKNTTLALVVGYPDIASVTATTINQTGQAVEGVLILMAVFLTVSLSASVFMNWYNSHVALVQR